MKRTRAAALPVCATPYFLSGGGVVVVVVVLSVVLVPVVPDVPSGGGVVVVVVVLSVVLGGVVVPVAVSPVVPLVPDVVLGVVVVVVVVSVVPVAVSSRLQALSDAVTTTAASRIFVTFESDLIVYSSFTSIECRPRFMRLRKRRKRHSVPQLSLISTRGRDHQGTDAARHVAPFSARIRL